MLRRLQPLKLATKALRATQARSVNFYQPHAGLIKPPALRFFSTGETEEKDDSAEFVSFKQPKKEEKKFMVSDSFPLDVNGVHPLPELSQKPIIENFFETRGIENDFVLEFLSEKFYHVIKALCEGDKDTIANNTEKYFGEKLISNMDAIKKSGLKFDPSKGDEVKAFAVQDQTNYGALRKNFISDNEETYIVNTFLVRGVSSDRDSNGPNYDFQVSRTEGDLGIRNYLHKYFSGNTHYYQHLAYEKELEELDRIKENQKKRASKYQGLSEDDFNILGHNTKPDETGKKGKKTVDERPQISYDEQLETLNENIKVVEMQRTLREVPRKMKKEMMASSMRMHLKVIICFKNIGLFTMPMGKKPYGPEYSGNHIAAFECELKAPPLMSMIDHSDSQIMDAYRINFLHWKLSDIDNYMQGNTYFREYEDVSVWEKKMEATMKVAPKQPNRDQNSEVGETHPLEDLQKIVDFDDANIDTKSNRLMTPFHKMKANVELLKAGKEKKYETEFMDTIDKTAKEYLESLPKMGDRLVVEDE